MVEPPSSRVIGPLGDLRSHTGVAPQDLPDQPHLELSGALGAAKLATDLGVGVALESPDQDLSQVLTEEAEYAGQLDPRNRLLLCRGPLETMELDGQVLSLPGRPAPGNRP